MALHESRCSGWTMQEKLGAEFVVGLLDPVADIHMVEGKVHIVHEAAFFQVFYG